MSEVEEKVSRLLQECLRVALCEPRGPPDPPLELHGGVPVELRSLLQEAVERKWPFVEEKWQYKDSVSPEDKINSSDLIRDHLSQLLVFLRDSIDAGKPDQAVAVVFLVDRLLYWMDGSHMLLKIAKALHKRYPDVPIAPQVIIRQARVYLNTGKLRKAEFILSSLIQNKASTGCWCYQRASDQTLVQAVSLQVRGQVLLTLGLWLEASELLWASLVGFYALPQPDKKGIGMSLGLLANTLSSMNQRDFYTLERNPHIWLGFLGESRDRLLCAAQAAKMAAVISQYGSLYVLTHAVAQGISLLSYCFSRRCPSELHQTYLVFAKDAFEIGLLTKTTGITVTSKLELHTFIKAAYCLCTAHRWISGMSDSLNTALSICQQALMLFVDYCATANSVFCSEIMEKIHLIKVLLKVERFPNSDPKSFVPDIYRSTELNSVSFTHSDFVKMLAVFEKHHHSVCEGLKNEDGRSHEMNHAHCLTAFQTDTEVLTTEISNWASSAAQRPLSSLLNSSGSNLSDISSSRARSSVSLEAITEHETNISLGHKKPSQARGTPEPSEMSGTHRRRHFQGNLAARMSSKSSGSCSSWEHLLGPSQSSIETEEDSREESSNVPEHSKDMKPKTHRLNSQFHPEKLETPRERSIQSDLSAIIFSGSPRRECVSGQSQSSIETEEDEKDDQINSEGKHSRSFRYETGAERQFHPVKEPSKPNSRRNASVPKGRDPNLRKTSSSSSSCSSWERVLSGSQSSIETEEDLLDPSQTSEQISEESNAGLKGFKNRSQAMLGPPRMTGTQRRNHFQRSQALMSSKNSSSCSSYELLGASQSSIETEEDFRDLSQNTIEKSGAVEHNKGPQNETNRTEDCGNKTHDKGKGIKKNLNEKTSLRCYSSCSSRSLEQSCIETEDDPSQSNQDPNIGGSRAIEYQKQIQNNLKPMQESKVIEDDPPKRSATKQTDAPRGQLFRSSIETEEDTLDPSRNINVEDSVVGDVMEASSQFRAIPQASAAHRRRNLQRNLQVSLRSGKSSQGHASGASQSSVETEEGTTDSNSVSEGIQGQAKATTEEKATETQKETTQKNPVPRTNSESSSSCSSWEQVFGQTQSSIKTEEEVDSYASKCKKEIKKQSKSGIESRKNILELPHSHRDVNDSADTSSSFSPCGSFRSQSSWEELSLNPSDDGSGLRKMQDPERIHSSDKGLSQKGNIRKSKEAESDSFEKLDFEHLSVNENHQNMVIPPEFSSNGDSTAPCSGCFEKCIIGDEFLTEQDYRALLAGVCHRCLMERLPNKLLKPLDDAQRKKVYDVIVLKYSRASDEWTGSESSVYIGERMELKGQQRQAIRLQYLHQEQLLSSYVGKEYLRERGLHAHLEDVQRQMTAQYYVTEFNKRLYDNNVTTQIFFIPSQVLLVLESSQILTCVSAEPFMSGTFVKLTNNTNKTQPKYEATKYGLAFGHFTYEFSQRQEVVVDLQGWITLNGKGLTYLTDPQIHSLKNQRSRRSQQSGIAKFIQYQHGNECNEICRAARLPRITS